MTTRWFLPVPPPGDDPADLAAFRAAWLAASDTAPVLAVLSEPLGLPGASLPAYGVPGDGCCRDCLRPPVYSLGLCVYCSELAQVRARRWPSECEHGPGDGCPACQGHLALHDDNPSLARVAVLLMLLAAALLAVLWAAGVIT